MLGYKGKSYDANVVRQFQQRGSFWKDALPILAFRAISTLAEPVTRELTEEDILNDAHQLEVDFLHS